MRACPGVTTESGAGPQTRSKGWVNPVQGILGLAVLCAGSAVYVLHRPVSGLPYWGEFLSVGPGLSWFFVHMGPAFPSFCHACGFTLLTVAAVNGKARAAAAAAVFWAAVNLLFELGQHPGVAPGLERILYNAGDNKIFAAMQCYFAGGGFDVYDVAALLAGAGAGYFAARLTIERRAMT